MSRDGSIAPKERVNITYRSSTSGASEDVELPLKLLFIGRYSTKENAAPIEERKPIRVDKDNFNAVMFEQDLALSMVVPSRLTSDVGELSVTLRFRKLADMEPDSIVEQVPELSMLMQLRAALTALKGPLGNQKAFRARIQQILADPSDRARLIKELGRGESQ